MEEAETLVLKVLEAHTPPGKCPLAGNSVGQVSKQPSNL
jgi:oligoribonuclease (3'-5' exoribonuclease)